MTENAAQKQPVSPDPEQEKTHTEGIEESPSQAAKEAVKVDAALSAPTAEEEIAELKNQLLRALAEVENTKKRAARDMQDARDYAVTSFARDLIVVMENMMMAKASVAEEKLAGNADLKTLMQGLDLTSNELAKVFERFGIRRLHPARGDVFDHHFHQAVAHVPVPDAAPGTVIDVMQAGYVIKDRLLRPAMVAVAKEANG